ncbi:MAG: DUF4178 domain-containing protein [Clostridium sp.]|nr:DUF4178 domain-containing protein [Clostridium sp.]
MQLAITLIILFIVIIILVPTIGLNVIFLILGAVVAWAIIMRNKSIKENLNKVPEQVPHVVNLERGGVFELKGVGDDFKDMTLKVIAKHLYQEGDFSWFELECDDGSDEKVWVEVEDDDETTVSVVLKKMKLQDINTTPAMLEIIDDDESGNVFGYSYQDSGDAVFYRFCDDSRSEKLYYWDFIKGNRILSVEKWNENDYEVYISQKMRPSQVTVLRNNEA